FFCYSHSAHPTLHSFPTRRSSDLIMRVNLARFVFSQSCSLLRRVVSRNERIISLTLSFSAATSPCASTVMERVRSPLVTAVATRSEEHTSELQSLRHLVCRLLLEK